MAKQFLIDVKGGEEEGAQEPPRQPWEQSPWVWATSTTASSLFGVPSYVGGFPYGNVINVIRNFDNEYDPAIRWVYIGDANLIRHCPCKITCKKPDDEQFTECPGMIANERGGKDCPFNGSCKPRPGFEHLFSTLEE